MFTKLFVRRAAMLFGFVTFLLFASVGMVFAVPIGSRDGSPSPRLSAGSEASAGSVGDDLLRSPHSHDTDASRALTQEACCGPSPLDVTKVVRFVGSCESLGEAVKPVAVRSSLKPRADKNLSPQQILKRFLLEVVDGGLNPADALEWQFAAVEYNLGYPGRLVEWLLARPIPDDVRELVAQLSLEQPIPWAHRNCPRTCTIGNPKKCGYCTGVFVRACLLCRDHTCVNCCPGSAR